MQPSFRERIAPRQRPWVPAARAVAGPALAGVVLAALPLLGRPVASAPAQRSAWLLHQFSVTHFDYGQPSRNEVREASARSFAFGGEYTVPGGNAYTANGRLTVSVPDRIESGGAYSVDARAAGDIGVVGAVGADGELAYVELRSLCWGGDEEGQARDEKRLMPGTAAVSLSATVPPLAFVAPAIVGPTEPASHNCEFRATLHVGLAVGWSVFVQAQYRQALPTEPVLTLDATTTRLPPSGVAPSESALTATLTDAAGRPIAGQRLDFRLEPADMGRLQPAGGSTDAGGVVRLRYTAPTLAELGGRNRVVVRVAAPGRGLERTLALEIESYRLALTVEPDRLPITDPPAAARLRIVAERFDGRPAGGDIVELELDPPDMGELLGETLLENRVVTDAQGVAELQFLAPPAAAMRQRNLVTIFATNISHGGEDAAAIRFQGLGVTSTQPPEGVRDVDLKPGGGWVIRFDRALDPASVGPRTVKVQTLWHGDLAARPEVDGATLRIRVTQDPIPDVGLVATAWLAGGAGGLRGTDGSLLPGDFTVRFTTRPRLDPRIVVSQVVDDPREAVYGVLSVAPKPFVLRVTAGLSADSELTEEKATVTLQHPTGGEQTLDHTFYPGDWPPRVPDAAVRRGNSANFLVRTIPPAGGLRVTAKIRPFFAPDDAAVAARPATVNVNRWNNARTALGLGVLLVPLQNDRLPGYEWNVSRGQLQRWAARLGADAVRYLPLPSLSVRLGYFADTSCFDPERCDFDRRPWTVFSHWVRHVGRAGYATPWSYVVPVVPAGWFAARFAGHPDVLANPQLYHNMVNNGIWSDAAIPRDVTRSAPAESAILEANASDAAFVHALGDVRGLPHSSAARDELAGYDLAEDRAIVSNATGWTGAHTSLMNEAVGYGQEWISQADYVSLLDRWTQKSCAGIPPCPPESPTGGEGASAQPAVPPPSVTVQGARRPAYDGADAEPVPLIGVSGTLYAGGTESATIEPLIWFDGHPSPAAGGDGDYAVVLRDGAGASLGRYAFTPVFGPVDGGRLASFLFALPRPAGLAAVTLEHGDTELGALRASANGPVVTLTRPAADRTYRGAVEVGWTGRDADGDRLSYHLLFSPDGGRTWLPLLVDSTRTDLSLPTEELPNGPDARLRVIASDGFTSAQAEIGLGLAGAQRVLATVPEDGARGVSPHTALRVLVRDPLDPVTVNAGSFSLRDLTGAVVPGVLGYQPLDGSVRFEPSAPLPEARTFEARLTTAALTMDGRALGTDHVWRFTTRGRAIYLPRAQQAGNSRPATEAPPPTLRPPLSPTPGPTRPPPSPTAPSPTRTPTVPASPVATTTNTRQPTSPAPPTSTATERPTPPPSPTVAPPGGLTAVGALTTGTDASRTRQAFAPGEPILLWVGVDNRTGAPTTADVELVVVGDNGWAPDALAWRGALAVPTGVTWFRLERTVPAGTPAGAYRLVASVLQAGQASAASADFFIATSVQRVDDFSDPRSGWTVHDDASARGGYLAGAFQILVKVADFWRFDTANDTATDFALEADVAFVGEAAGAAGLVFDVSADSQSFLVFAVVRDGRFGLYRRGAGLWQAVLPFAASGHVDRTTNHLMLARVGPEVRLYANGQQLAVTSEAAGAGGRVGLYAEGVEAGLDARFDEFRLYRVR